MSYQGTLDETIDKILEAKMASKEPLLAKLIALELCEKNKPALRKGSGADFWLHGGYHTARAAVTKRINLITNLAPSADTKQQTLPGFDHLHHYYMVNRNGDDLGLPIEQLTDLELTRVERRLDAMAETCKAHAREVRRFRLQRSAAAAGKPEAAA